MTSAYCQMICEKIWDTSKFSAHHTLAREEPSMQEGPAWSVYTQDVNGGNQSLVCSRDMRTEGHLYVCKVRDERSQGHMGGSVIERLPSAQSIILETHDRIPAGAPCMEPASPSACVSASLSFSLSLSLFLSVSDE